MKVIQISEPNFEDTFRHLTQRMALWMQVNPQSTARELYEKLVIELIEFKRLLEAS